MQIYIAEGTQQTGPFDLDTIKQGLSTGRYAPSQLAWYEGAPGWEPISKLPGMEALLAPPPRPFPSPAPVVAPPAYQPAPTAPPAYAPTPYAPGPAQGYGAYPLPQQAYAPASYAPGAGGRSSKLGLVLALGGTLLGLLAIAFAGAKLARALASQETHDAAGTNTPAPGPAKPAPGTRHFVSNRAVYSGDLAAHYIAFSFDYPQEWTLQENVKDAFVTLKHFVKAPSGKSVQAEYVGFSYAYNQPGYPMSKYLNVTGPQLLAMIVDPMMKEFPDATKTSARSGRFGNYPSQEVLITDPASDDHAGIYFRLAVVAGPGDSPEGMGVTLIGSDMAGSKSADTLGDSGGMRTIRDSFRFEP